MNNERSCGMCRRKRRGCDRAKPICGQCVETGQVCSYSTDASNSTWDHPCCVCRLKKRACDRAVPICGSCMERGLLEDCSYRPEDMPPPSSYGKRQSHPTPVALSDSPAPPNKKQVIPVFYENGIAFHGIPRPRHSLDMHRMDSMRQSQFAPAVSSRVSVGNHEMAEDLTYSPNVRLWQRHSLTHSSLGPLADGIRRRAPSTSNDRQLEQAHLARRDRAVAERTGVVKQEEMAGSNQDQLQVSEVPRQLSAHKQSSADGLPRVPKELSDRVIAGYLTREYVNLPIFDLQDFKSAYEASKADENAGPESSPFQEVLKIIFSFSSLSIKTVGPNGVLPSFDNGRKLAGFVDYDGDLWATLQSYILQCQYLNATGDPRKAWNLIGFALRTAQTLGLHSKTRWLDVYNRKQRELSRKLWHSAILMERMISLQIGILPQTPNSSQLLLPTHLDTDYIDTISGGDHRTGVERPSMIEFLLACARLYSNVEDILAIEDEMRIRQDSCVAKKLLALDIKRFLKTDSILYDWNISLPSFLQKDVSGGFPHDPIINRQRNICRICYLHIRLRLYRPFFVMGMALTANCNCKPGGTVHITGDEHNSPDSPSALGVVRDSSVKCVAAALELVDILKIHEYGLHIGEHEQVDPDLSPIPSFWESVDSLYACGTVLLAARLNPIFRSNYGESQVNLEQIDESWKNLLVLLEYYEDISRNNNTKNVAASCLRTLGILFDAVECPVAETDVTAAFDNGTKTRIFQRIGVDAPGQSRTRMSPASGSELPTDQQSAKGHKRWSWIESLPIDLEG